MMNGGRRTTRYEIPIAAVDMNLSSQQRVVSIILSNPAIYISLSLTVALARGISRWIKYT